MWFSAIPTMWCLVVGSLVSLWKPQDPKKLNPELISPAFRKLFSFWPWIGPKITDYIDNKLQIGVNYVTIYSHTSPLNNPLCQKVMCDTNLFNQK